MLKNGWIGRKASGGFYRVNKDGGKRVKESISLVTAAYSPSVKAQLDSLDASKKGGLQVLLKQPDKGGKFAWAMASQGLVYAASLVPEIADNIADVDEAMKDGYNWNMGPFETIDKMGAAWFAEQLTAAKIAVPPLLKLAAEKGGFYKVENGKLKYLTTAGTYTDIVRPEGVLKLSDIKRASKPVLRNGSAKVWDIGDGVLCFEFTSKMNSMDPLIMALYKDTLKLFKSNSALKALVIHNEGPNFSVGANVGLILFAANIAVWSEIESQIEDGQKTYLALKQAPFPVVTAPLGLALGGGCEILLHSDAIQAHAETYIGLVECGVGLVPGWGGCKEMLLRQKKDPRNPKGPHARGGEGVRADRYRSGLQVGTGSRRDGHPAQDRRHHHEPRPPARRRQSQGAEACGKLCAAQGGNDLPARPDRCRGVETGARRFQGSGQADAV